MGHSHARVSLCQCCPGAVLCAAEGWGGWEDPELELKGMSRPEGTMINPTAPFPSRITPPEWGRDEQLLPGYGLCLPVMVFRVMWLNS